MSDLPISRFRVKFKAHQDIHLPPYAGSALRGAFGHALKNIACLTASMNKGVCKCQPAATCLYRRLFDPVRQELTLQSRLQDVPPPFVIEAHSLEQQIQSNQEACFYMTLIGHFAHSQQMLIQLAWQRALAVGLGIQLTQGQAQSQLLSFELCDQPQLALAANDQIRLHFVTHARIQHHGKMLNVENFDAILLCRSITRRYLSMLEAYSDEMLSAEQIQQLYADVNQVQSEFKLEWKTWSRWSNRQKKKMPMDGLLGEVKLTNVSEQLWHLIHLGQWLHTGKGCVFGLGQYVLK